MIQDQTRWHPKVALVSDPTDLPVSGRSLDLIILVHTLELSVDPYQVLRDGEPIGSVPDDGSPDFGFVDAGRPNGLFTYTVRTVDGAGNESGDSNAVPVTIAEPLPPMPENLARPRDVLGRQVGGARGEPGQQPRDGGQRWPTYSGHPAKYYLHSLTCGRYKLIITNYNMGYKLHNPCYNFANPC